MNSPFRCVRGPSHSREERFKVSGKYEVDLADVKHFVGNPPIRMGSGWTEGVVEFRGKREEDIRVEGAGRLNQAVFSWKNLLMTASGSYVFDRNGINCSPILIKKDELNCRCGRLTRDSTLCRSRVMSMLRPRPPLLLPLSLNRKWGGDGRLDGEERIPCWQGRQYGRASSFIYRFHNKRAGVPSSATFQLRQTANGDLYIEELRYVLSTVTIQAEGKVERNKISSLRVRLDAPDLGQLSGSIAAKGIKAKGEVKADVSFHDLQYPLTRLPRLTGYMIVKNGYLTFPFLAKPIENIDAVCELTENRYEMNTTNLRAGASAIEKATLVVEGDERPRLALRLSAVRLNANDIFPDTGKPWRIHAIRQDSFLSKMSGEIHLQAKQTQWGRISLKNLDTKLSFADRKLILNDGSGGVFGGTAAQRAVSILQPPSPVRAYRHY